MLTISTTYDVQSDRLVTIKLPQEVYPGKHELLIVVEQQKKEKRIGTTIANSIMRFAGTVPAFRSLDGVSFQQSIRMKWE
uniref:Uncharacterized protein n=1 Tax=Chlorobium chlorochromatii (strain CaD3) TaxID=340177 RepID=Q3ASC6_CHLCH